LAINVGQGLREVGRPVLLGYLAGVVPEAAPFLDQTGGLAEAHPLVLAEIEGL